MKYFSLAVGYLIFTGANGIVPALAAETQTSASSVIVVADLDVIHEHNRLVSLAIDSSLALSKAGTAAAASHNWDQAKDLYLQALEKWKENGDANLGMASYSHAAGDNTGELKYYRAYIYRGEPSETSFQTCDTAKMLYYAQLLDKGGQTGEAKMVYNHATSLLKYMDGKPSYGNLMPLFGAEPGQIAYRSNRLQALVQVGTGINTLDTQELKDSERLAHLKEAVRLYPDSPEIQSYLSYQLNTVGDAAGAKAAMTRANGLGYQRVVALLNAQTAQMQAERTQK